jgi:glutaredoxin
MRKTSVVAIFLLDILVITAAFTQSAKLFSVNFNRGSKAASSSRRPTVMNLFQNLANGLKGGGSGGVNVSPPPTPIFPAKVAVPTWEELLATVKSTEVGKRLSEQQDLRSKGQGPTNTDNKFRLFGAKSEDEIRVVLYRDAAAWCPYCQKVWLLLEEKQIPFRIEKINMRSYGDKPEWFLQKVPRGLLPVIELDGRCVRACTPAACRIANPWIF